MLDTKFKYSDSEYFRKLYQEAEELHGWITKNLPRDFNLMVSPQSDNTILVEIRTKGGDWHRFFGRPKSLTSQLEYFLETWS